MTVKREYNLPNCTIVLEGLSDEKDAQDSTEAQPLMSSLLNVECHFVGQDRSLSGGKDFFDSLVKAVSSYAQEFLSGLRHPTQNKPGSDRVHLEKVQQKNLHRLIWQPADSNQEKVEVELTSVQLFDLVEAVDQFFADNYTLPEMSLELQPVPRRYRRVEEPIVKQIAPAALGITSLALTAIALFFVPFPEVRRPEPKPSSTPTETPSETSPESNTEETKPKTEQ